MQSNENYKYNNGYYANLYVIDTKLYITAIVAAIGLVFLFAFPLVKIGSIEISYSEYTGMALRSKEYLLFAISTCLFSMPLVYALYLIQLWRAPKFYIKFMEEGSIYNAQKVFNSVNNTTDIKRGSIMWIAVPIVFLFFCSADEERNMIEYMGSGFWLYSLCMVVMVFLVYTSQAPSLQAIADQYAKNKAESSEEKNH